MIYEQMAKVVSTPQSNRPLMIPSRPLPFEEK